MSFFPSWIRSVGVLVFRSKALSFLCVIAEMTVGKDQEVTVKSKGAGGQGKVAAKVTAPSGKAVASKVWHMMRIFLTKLLEEPSECFSNI